MIPLRDENPTRRVPFVNYALIIINVLVFLWQLSLGSNAGEVAFYQYGMIPARLFGTADLQADTTTIPAWSTVFTSMFMHGGLMHLGSNMLFLWIFGDNVEDSMGHVRYLAFYAACVVAAAFAQALVNPDSTGPMVGASGAISGVLGAYLLLHPHATVRTAIFLGFFFTHCISAGAHRAGTVVVAAASERLPLRCGRAWGCVLGSCRWVCRWDGASAVLQEKRRAVVPASPSPSI